MYDLVMFETAQMYDEHVRFDMLLLLSYCYFSVLKFHEQNEPFLCQVIAKLILCIVTVGLLNSRLASKLNLCYQCVMALYK